MWAKIENGQMAKYPYSLSDLQVDNPNVSFPVPVSSEILAEYGVYDVQSTPVPNINYTQDVSEGSPVFEDGVWKQAWVVTNKSSQEIAEITEQSRRSAYTVESDPIFFKWQRGEATQAEWLAKVEEIKSRYQG